MDFYTQQEQNLEKFMRSRGGIYRPDATPFPDEKDEPVTAGSSRTSDSNHSAFSGHTAGSGRSSDNGSTSVSDSADADNVKRYVSHSAYPAAVSAESDPTRDNTDGEPSDNHDFSDSDSADSRESGQTGFDSVDPIRFTAQEIIIPKAKNHHTGAILLILAVLGAAAGFLLYEKLFDALSYDTVYSYLTLRLRGGFFSNASSSFLGALTWLIIPFVSGLCAVGQPTAIAIMPIKGMGIGIVGAYFLTTYGINGLWAFAALVLPSALIGTAITAYQCKCALTCSCRLFRYITGKSTDPRPTRFYGGYMSSTLLCVICCFLLGIIDAGISAVFGGLFVI